MQKATGLLALIMLVFAMGCQVSADEPAQKWIDFMKKHNAKIHDGTFKADEFKAEGTPLAAELTAKVDPKEKKLLMTESVLNEWKKVHDDFDIAVAKVGNREAQTAFLEVTKDLKAAMK